jgi:peptide/nickel transport system permease protein
VLANPAFRTLAPDERAKLVQQKIASEEARLGLNQPFAVRSVRYLTNALTLNLGRAQNMISDHGSKEVRSILLERMPATLLLTGTSELFIFFVGVLLALTLSRKYGSFWDKVIIGLSPTSAVPPWFIGIFLILIFAAIFKILPFGGLLDSPPPTNPFEYGLNILKHLTLPATAVILSAIFLSIYNWRTFFLIYSSEDYVDMAKAKGLSSRDVERRYILRPTLPTIITNFALLLIGLWTGFIITETVFLWPGLGRTLYSAIGLYDTPVIVGSTIIYAYLLAITVFTLDFVYALVDPRVKVGGGGGQV